jgi:cobalt-zinc-cadmium efflux system protein
VGAPVGSRLRIALALTAVVALVELGGGLVSHSLALTADAAHVAMDAVALAIAVAAEWQARRPATERQTYGFARMEVLAALANGGLLFAVTVLIAVEAFKRFAAPELPAGGIMFAIAAFGFAVNGGLGLLLTHDARSNINAKAALFHVAGDALGALAVMIGGVIILTLHLQWVDPLLSLFVAVIIVVGVVRIVGEAAHVLLESAPSHATMDAVRSAMRGVPGVVGVHDLHVWTIGGASHVLTSHVLLRDGQISEATAILRSIEDRMRATFGITHVTLQFECESCAVDERIVCTQAVEPHAGSAP